MALIKCPECKVDVSDRALTCPSCGFPLKNEQQAQIMRDKPENAGVSPHGRKLLIIGAFILVVFALVWKTGMLSPAPDKAAPPSAGEAREYAAADKHAEREARKALQRSESETRQAARKAEQKRKQEERYAQREALQAERNGDRARKQEEKERKQQDRLRAEAERLAKLPRLNAARLLLEYHEDPIIADRKYKRQQIILIGTIDSIEQNARGRPSLLLRGAPAIEYASASLEHGAVERPVLAFVRADLKKSAAQRASGLAIGDSVTLMGKVLGISMDEVRVGDCVFFDNSDTVPDDEQDR